MSNYGYFNNGKGKGGKGKGYGKGFSNGYQNSYSSNSFSYNQQNSWNQSSAPNADDPFKLCFKCGTPNHDSGSCIMDYESKKWGVLRNSAFECKKAIMDEARQTDFYARTFNTTPKSAQLDTTLPDNAQYPVLLTGITPDMRIETIDQLGGLFSGFIKSVPYTKAGSIFIYVSCVLFYETEKEQKKACKALANYEINNKSVYASLTTRRVAKTLSKGIGKSKGKTPAAQSCMIVKRNRDGSKSKVGEPKDSDSSSSSESSSSESSSSSSSSSSDSSDPDHKKSKKKKKKEKKKHAKSSKDKGKERVHEEPSKLKVHVVKPGKNGKAASQQMDLDTENSSCQPNTASDEILKTISKHDEDIKGLFFQVRETREDVKMVSSRLEKHIDDLPGLLDSSSSKMLTHLAQMLGKDSIVPPSTQNIVIQDSPNPAALRKKVGATYIVEDENNGDENSVPGFDLNLIGSDSEMSGREVESPEHCPIVEMDGSLGPSPSAYTAKKKKKGKGKGSLEIATIPAKGPKSKCPLKITPPAQVGNKFDNGPSSHVASSSGLEKLPQHPGSSVDPSKRLSFSFTPPIQAPSLRVPHDGPIKQLVPGQKVTFTLEPDRNARVECGIVYKECPTDLSYLIMKMEPRHLYRFERPTVEQMDNAIPVPHYLVEVIPDDLNIDDLVHMMSTLNRRKTQSSAALARNNGRISPIQRTLV